MIMIHDQNHFVFWHTNFKIIHLKKANIQLELFKILVISLLLYHDISIKSKQISDYVCIIASELARELILALFIFIIFIVLFLSWQDFYQFLSCEY